MLSEEIKNGLYKGSNGESWWYKNNLLHREDGPAVEYKDGRKEWWINGKRHRKDGPAIESLEGKYWLQNGKYHREDGPAIEEYANGHKMWFVQGVEYSEEEFHIYKEKKNLNESLQNYLNEKDSLSIKIKI